MNKLKGYKFIKKKMTHSLDTVCRVWGVTPSLTLSRMHMSSVKKHCFQNKRFLFLKTHYSIFDKILLDNPSNKYVGQSSEVNCWTTLRNIPLDILRRELLDNFPKQFFGQLSDIIFFDNPQILFVCGHTPIINYESTLQKTCHALTSTVLGCPSAYEMQYVISQQFMLIYLSMHILTKFTHKQHVIHFSNNNTQNGPNLGPIENRAPLGPFTVNHRIIGISKHTTKPKDTSPWIKIKPQYSPELPENLTRTMRKQFQNSARTVRKQSQKFLKIPTLSPKN